MVQSMCPSPKEFTNAMRELIGGCSVITAGSDDDISGLVVTSAISLSAEPPLLLACVNRNSSTWPLLQKYSRFGCSTLGAHHRNVAERFAGFGGVKGKDRYAGAEWTATEHGTLLLSDSPAAFDCKVEEMLDRATHSIIIGRVCKIRTSPGKGAMTYWNGSFHALHS